jgi:hypothetical protein
LRTKSGLPTLAWILFGLLGFSAAALWLGGPERKTYPSAMSYGASGLKAYASVLENLGYRVEISRDPHPKLGPEDVAIVSHIWDNEPG